MENELVNLQQAWDKIKQDVIMNDPKSKQVILLRTDLVYPIDLYQDTVVIGVKNQFYLDHFEDDGCLLNKIILFLGRQVRLSVRLVKYFSDQEQVEAEEKQKAEEAKNLKEVKEYRNLEYRKEHSRIPAHAFIDERFEDLEINEGNKEIIEKCKNFIANENRDYWFLTLSGKTGTSKTHLLFAMGVEAVKSKDVQYWHCGDLLDIFQRGQFDQTYFEVIDELKVIPLLILDDYGDFKESEFKTEKLDILIDHRYENRFDTILTTNKTLKELITMNQRIASRLMENLFIQTKGDDYRVKLSKNKTNFDLSKPIIRGGYVAKMQRPNGW